MNGKEFAKSLLSKKKYCFQVFFWQLY